MPSGELDRYRAKRDFERTTEPLGKRRHRESPAPRFVIQQHDARRMHFDLRLELDGVLKSWAVPRGPSTDPREKRLAVQVEDHPLDYADFEGVIAPGGYGAGAVIVWDTGTYRNLATRDEREVPMAEGLSDGHVTVWLEGKKLRGGYALQRTSGGDQPQWLLIKRRDEEADARRHPVRTQPESVLSGRTVEQIGAAATEEDDQ